MQTLLTRVLAVFLALQPWAFGMLSAPRSKSAASSLSSPAQDQTVLENARVAIQVQNANSDLGVVPKITASLESPVFYLVSSWRIAAAPMQQNDVLARFSRWNE